MNFKLIKACFFFFLFLLLTVLSGGYAQKVAQPDPTKKKKTKPLNYQIQLDVIASGYDSSGCWFHPRAGAIPGKTPTVVLTMQKWVFKAGTSDLFLPLQVIRTEDLGKTWTTPTDQSAALGRLPEPDNIEVGVSDFTPKYHNQTHKLLGIGHTVRYRENNLVKESSRQTVWSVYDPVTHNWSMRQALKMPAEPIFYNAGAGAVQRVDLPDGDILLPVYYKIGKSSLFGATVVKCSFNGQELKYKEHGTELTLNTGRGFVEPSLTKFKDKYYLTLRNNDSGYVAVSKDGLHFTKPSVWRFDDGQDLGSYNPQQHWVTHSNGLFLVYTRRGANNDHVFRHRAPLFMAQVDPERMVIIRATEKILVPNKGARMGNFGVVNVNENETWVPPPKACGTGVKNTGRITMYMRPASSGKSVIKTGIKINLSAKAILFSC